MSSTDRQNRLLLAEDWKRVYQSFRNADFQSYDFDNLRRTMISYLRENYPEDFNDYVESSEYLALIDLIAYLGQNLSFRIDLNARENFLELADRRESVLRLARLLSYNPKRIQAANGLLKIESISTSEEIRDANNVNLKNQTIVWNDPANPDWREQFLKVLNSTLPVNNTFGRPVKADTVTGVPTQQYRMNSTNAEVPSYSFSKSIDGRSTRFEIVSTDVVDSVIVEEPPFPGNNFAFLYRDDGKGAASSNTGFFCHFRQGTIDEGVFNITNPSTNQVVAIDATNVNNTDVWLYKLDALGNEDELWTKVDSVEGNNVVYNSLSKDLRNIYSVLTRVDDRISLIFADGVFGNLPKGQFRVYYRTSRKERVIVTPDDMRGISVVIPYRARSGKIEELTFTFELRYTVDNSSTSETNASIKTNAPATYYTQNRLVTGEDYNIGPLAISQEIVKTKAVNRTTSGISRYFDLIDATGKYSKTNLFGTDGVVYKETLSPKTSFDFVTRTDVEGALTNTVEPILASNIVRNYYYDQFPDILVQDLGVTWSNETTDTNLATGYFLSAEGVRSQLGAFTGSTLQLIKPGALVKFVAPSGYHFMLENNNALMLGEADHPNSTTYLYTKIVSVDGDGTQETEAELGAVSLNDIIPDGAVLNQIIAPLANTLQTDVKTQLTDQIFSYKTFGLRFDTVTAQWRLITENNLAANAPFSAGKTGDISGNQLDASWILKFETNGSTYTISYRGLRYVFESDQEIRFYYDSSDKIYNNITGKIVKDKITVLNINKKPDALVPFTVDYDWQIIEEYRDAAGYVDSKKIQISFFDDDDDGVVDDPQIFDEIVAPNSGSVTDKYVFFKKVTTADGVEDYNYVSNSTENILVLQNKNSLAPLSTYNDGQIFYYIDENIFETLNRTTNVLSLNADYKARLGRDGLKFQYIHAADANTRIDPSASNIIDIYLLTKAFDTAYRLWLDGTSTTRPLPPSSDSLETSYGLQIDKIKSLSDEVVYHPVKYKVLFGNKAENDLQAKFKIVKNPDLVLNDNEVRSRVISAINQFFALENWEFGETFYFSELSSYVMNQLAPDLVTFILVPVQDSQSFGSLYEIKSESDEVFISGATVNDIEIIDAITATRLKASGNVVVQSTTENTGVQSSTNSQGTIVGTLSSSSSGSSSSGSSSSGSSSSGSSSSGSSSSGGGYSY